jgi:hypothetical protein
MMFEESRTDCIFDLSIVLLNKMIEEVAYDILTFY